MSQSEVLLGGLRTDSTYSCHFLKEVVQERVEVERPFSAAGHRPATTVATKLPRGQRGTRPLAGSGCQMSLVRVLNANA